MKKLFIVLNVFAVIAVFALITAIFTYSPLPPEQVIASTPKQADIFVNDLFPGLEPPSTPSDISMIVDSDLFSPDRAGVSETATTAITSRPKTNRFDLAGICVMGDINGAFIVFGRKGARKQFFSVGSTIGNTGYKLLEVFPEQGSIVLGVGNSRLTLTLDRDDSASRRRREVKPQTISPASSTRVSSGRGAAGGTSDKVKEKRRRILERLKRNKTKK